MGTRAVVPLLLLVVVLSGCGKTGKASEGAQDTLFTKVSDKMCVDRGQALLFYTETKIAVVQLRSGIERGCKAKKLDPVACAEVNQVSNLLRTADIELQKKITDPEVIIDTVAIMNALKLAVGIASKLI